MNASPVTGLILAGGAGSRMGGADKGLVEWRRRALIEWVIAAIAPQVGPLIISANRNLDRYRAFGYPVVCDLRADFPGPLAGIEAGLAAATTADVLVVPCDGPTLPADLVTRLTAARGPARAACVQLAGRLNPLHALVDRSLAGELTAWLDRGERKAGAWLEAIGTIPVAFDDAASVFRNLNHRGNDMLPGTDA